MSLISGRTAVVVSTARTGLAKSFRGKLNDTHGAALAGHAIKHAIARAGVSPEEVEDVFIGCGIPEGAAGWNVARNAALWAGCPVTTSGATINRFCSSGLQAVACASHSILVEGASVAIGGGVDSLSLCQPNWVKGVVTEKKLMQTYPALWMPMIDTADLVAQREAVSREDLDAYALQSQKRCAAAQQAGKFSDEIAPMQVTMKVPLVPNAGVFFRGRKRPREDRLNRCFGFDGDEERIAGLVLRGLISYLKNTYAGGSFVVFSNVIKVHFDFLPFAARRR